MKIGQGIINGERKVFLYDNGKFYTLNSEGISCVLKDSLNIIKSFNLLKDFLKNNLEETKVERILPPVYPEKVFLPAVNFKSHSSESSTPPPRQPYFFMKGRNAIIGNEDPIIIPRNLRRVDYEGEIGIVIGKRGKYIKKEEALDYVFGFTVVNDVSFRDYQFPEIHPYGLNWVMGKSLDNGLPIGPWIVTKDELKLPLRITTRVNGRTVQEGSMEDMIFNVEELISYLSNGITLEPGDVITTGTPAGVAEFGTKEYLKDGDLVEVEVTQIGRLKNPVKEDTTKL